MKIKHELFLRARTEVPPEAFRTTEKGDRVVASSPWSQPEWRAEELVTAVRNCSDAILIGDSLLVYPDGRMSVFPTRLSGGKWVSEIKAAIAALPAVWEWGLSVRRAQDELAAELSSLVGSKLTLPEGDRTFFGRKAQELKAEVKALVEKFRAAAEPLPDLSGRSASKLAELLEAAWGQTPTAKREAEEAYRRHREEDAEAAALHEKERIAARRRVRRILRKEGLI